MEGTNGPPAAHGTSVHRPPLYRPSAGAWATVAAALFRAIIELAGQGVQLAFFTLRRESWRREIAACVAREPLPALAIPSLPSVIPRSAKEIPR